MNTYYEVTTAVFDSGRIAVSITATVEANAIPENTYTSKKRCDIYHDWFDSYEDACEFILEAKDA